MAIDVAQVITSSGNGFFVGQSSYVDQLGNRQRVHESGKEQFTKMGFTDLVWYNKYKDKFDEVRYYTASG